MFNHKKIIKKCKCNLTKGESVKQIRKYSTYNVSNRIMSSTKIEMNWHVFVYAKSWFIDCVNKML